MIQSGCCGGGGCCIEKTDHEQDGVQTVKGSSVLYDASKFKPLDPTQEPIFPAGLKMNSPPLPLAIKGPRVSWYRPMALVELLELRSQFPHEDEKDKPQNKVVVGNTEIGMSVTDSESAITVVHSIHTAISSLHTHTYTCTARH